MGLAFLFILWYSGNIDVVQLPGIVTLRLDTALMTVREELLAVRNRGSNSSRGLKLIFRPLPSVPLYPTLPLAGLLFYLTFP